MKGNGQPFTYDHLMRALHSKGVPIVSVSSTTDGIARDVADAIRAHSLDMVVAGRHDGRPVTFAKGYELVFGERLTLKRGAA